MECIDEVEPRRGSGPHGVDKDLSNNMEHIDNDEPTGRLGLEKDLSRVSKHYDIGGKGFLTPAEQKARELDHKNEGNLSNAQVVGLIERTEDLKKANKMLLRYMIVLLVVTVILGCSQIATAIVVVRLSKDTSVNSSSGLMTAKEGGKPVVVVSTGTTTVIHVNQETHDRACVRIEDLEKMVSGTAQGTRSNAVLRSNNSLTSMSFQSVVSNETHTCLTGTGGGLMCTEFEPCDEAELDGSGGGQRRRTLEEQTRAKHAVKQRIRRHLCVDIYECLLGPGGGGGESQDGGECKECTPCCSMVNMRP